MLMTLIRRELLDNLMTFRFAAAVFITLLLVVAVTAVLQDTSLESYNTSDTSAELRNDRPGWEDCTFVKMLGQNHRMILFLTVGRDNSFLSIDRLCSR